MQHALIDQTFDVMSVIVVTNVLEESLRLLHLIYQDEMLVSKSVSAAIA